MTAKARPDRKKVPELYFAAWAECWCTDVQEDRADLPDRCPCHGGYLLGINTVPADSKTGHECVLATTGGLP